HVTGVQTCALPILMLSIRFYFTIAQIVCINVDDIGQFLLMTFFRLLSNQSYVPHDAQGAYQGGYFFYAVHVLIFSFMYQIPKRTIGLSNRFSCLVQQISNWDLVPAQD